MDMFDDFREGQYTSKKTHGVRRATKLVVEEWRARNDFVADKLARERPWYTLYPTTHVIKLPWLMVIIC